MKESERVEVVAKAKEDQAEKELLKQRLKQLEQLSFEDKIIEYKKLKQEVEYLQAMQGFFDNDIKKMIQFEYLLKYKHSVDYTCDHQLWMYIGSYYHYKNQYGEHDHYLLCKDEEQDGFCYNKYTCLECGKVIHSYDWENFEKEHFTLKNYDDIDNKKYQQLYYQSLFDTTVDGSRNIVIRKFKTNKSKSRKRKETQK